MADDNSTLRLSVMSLATGHVVEMGATEGCRDNRAGRLVQPVVGEVESS